MTTTTRARATKRSLDSMAIRERNENAVLGALAKHGPLSEADLCLLLDMARSTAWKTLTRLREAGEVRRHKGGIVGRAATLFELGEEPEVTARRTADTGPLTLHPLHLVVNAWVSGGRP